MAQKRFHKYGVEYNCPKAQSTAKGIYVLTVLDYNSFLSRLFICRLIFYLFL
jgi:hypothetical protein